MEHSIKPITNHNIKFFELLDRATCIPVFAIKLGQGFHNSDRTNALLSKAGYGPFPCILFGRLNGGKCHFDPYEWNDRTFQVAHMYLVDNIDKWGGMVDGAILDVEYILGETTEMRPTDLAIGYI